MAGKKLTELRALVHGIATAMFTTRRADGHLVSRPMVTLDEAPGADFWFVTALGSDKLHEIAGDPHVNLAYYRDRTKEWVSVSGTATVTQNRAKLRLLYRPTWNAWFPESSDPRHGTADDPRMALVGVKAHSALYVRSDRPAPLAALELLRGYVTGETPNVGSITKVAPRDLHAPRRAKPAAGVVDAAPAASSLSTPAPSKPSRSTPAPSTPAPATNSTRRTR